MRNRVMRFGAALAAVLLGGMLRAAEPPASIVVASTTSTQDSGLFTYLLPIVRERTGIEVKVVSQGTGQALDTARRGDADVVFVHDPDAEQRFVTEGYGVARHPVMYNDFLIVGPAADPARIRGGRDAVKALQSIAGGKQPFISRGDRSGTHQAELRLWSAAGIAVDPAPGRWYRAVGQGMGPTLNIASASDAYALVDRGTWISFRNKGTLQPMVEGDPRLFNQYGLILVNPAKHAHVKAGPGQRFIDFMLSAEGQKVIGDFRIEGQQLFHPNAGKTP
jgi:tungstate transport system substrate-binding protein